MAIHVRDNRGGNWFWLHNAIIDEYGAELSYAGIAVYVAICRHAGQDQSVWASQRALAQEIGGSRAQVQRELAKLQQLGLLTITEQINEHGQTSNTYYLLSPPECGATPHHTEAPGASHRGGVAPPRGTMAHHTEAPIINKTLVNKTHEQERWTKAVRILSDTMTPQSYTRWIAPLELAELVNNHALLTAPDATVADYVTKRLRARLAEALGVGDVDVRTNGQP